MKTRKSVQDEELKLSIVLSTGNSYLVSIAKSILDDAGIQYIVNNEHIQNLFGLGSIGGNFNPLSGAMEILVREDDETVAKELLKNLSE